jgi:hypothetical protein
VGGVGGLGEGSGCGLGGGLTGRKSAGNIRGELFSYADCCNFGKLIGIDALVAVRISSTLLKPAALLLLGASTVFGCSVANALTFNWSWTPIRYIPSTPTGPVTGTVSGLLDNTANQIGVVTVTSSPSIPSSGWDNSNWAFQSGSERGFTVLGGAVTRYNAFYKSQGNDQFLYFGNGSNFSAQVNDISESIFFDQIGGGTTTFTAVPGPLPILGLPAVLLFSRKLKKRIKASREASSKALV